MGNWLKFYILCIVYIKCLVMNSVFCDWSYGNTTKWDETWKQCAGLYQSPLNIIDSQAATVTKQVTLCFENFVTPIEADLTNNGKTAKLELPSSANVSVIGNRLYINNHYKLEEVHFHWRIGDTVSGSEHRINGKSASMEVHLVHYNLNYTRFETAKEKYDGVLVLSVLVDVSTNVSQNSFWSPFSDKLANIRSPGSKTKLAIKFSNFLPRNRDDFYLYKGSFTSPPCFETVTWVVYKERLLIPEEYLQRFWALRTANASGGSQVLASNIRPVKPLNSRIVLKTFQSSGDKDFESHVYERTFHGLDVVAQVTFYQCHVPASISLSILIPSLDIAWKSQNLTSDIQGVPLDVKEPYSATLEMHDHPKGRYKDNVHVNVKLNDIEIIEKYYNLSKDCLQLQDSCFWSSVGKSRTCSRRLIDTDENVLFTLTRQNQCDDVYDITIKYNRVIFETSMKAKTRVKLTPRAADDQLMIKGTLGRWYLFLNVDTEDRISRAKLFLDLSQSTLSGHGFLMEGVFHNDPNCHPSGTPVKLIVGITMGLFILAVIVLTGFLVRRNIKNSPKPNVLIEEDELDTAV